MGQEVTIALEAADAAELGRLLVPGHYKRTPQLNRLDLLAQQLPKSVVWFKGCMTGKKGKGKAQYTSWHLMSDVHASSAAAARPSSAAWSRSC